MPKIKPNESEKDFVNRYMNDPQAIADFPDPKQRLAVAYKTYDQAKDKK